ncbi:MAG: hypothetical protein OXD32_04380 [Endozoicomonadaceae bacterium]|nr:hypothetical protein [Endozoicomonadaceae bacterium]
MSYIYKVLYIFFIVFALYVTTANTAPPKEDKKDSARIYQVTKSTLNLVKTSPDFHENIIFCPQGVNVVESLASAMPAPLFPVDSVPDALQDTFDQYVFGDDNDEILKQANFVFYQDSLSKQYTDLLKSKGNPHIFESSQSLKHSADVAEANRIIAELTDNALKGIIKETDGFDSIVTSAVYFKGQWGVPCKKLGHVLWKKSSAVINAKDKMVDSFMTDTNDNKGIKTGETDGYDLFSLPINKADGKYKFIIAMPKSDSNTTPGHAISNDKIALNCINSAKNGKQLMKYTYLVIPIFHIKQNYDLSPLFQLNGYRFKTSQNVFIKVNEKGVEAASYTQSIMERSLPDYKRIEINKPFAYWIINTETDKILFMGTVYDPQYV